MLLVSACARQQGKSTDSVSSTDQPFVYEGEAVLGLEVDDRTDPREITLNRKDTGFRSVWDDNEPTNDEYKYKYSGGFATYSAKHRPLAVYSPKANKTFFTYGGAAPDNPEHLWHMVAYFDHQTGEVPRPTILLDKRTGDAHDNPVISVDDEGYVWIFSTAHGSWRPSYIHKSKKPYAIDSFEFVRATKLEQGKRVPMDNFSYFQPWHLREQGFIAFFASYGDAGGTILGPYGNPAQRTICYATSQDGELWSEWITLGAIGEGHYQISTQNTQKAGTAFNYHPIKKLPEKGLNYRTNLYYLETPDFGKTWQAADGTLLSIPLTEVNNAALIHNYESEGLLVYMKDMVFDKAGRPAILFLTSKGYESGPKNDPRTWRMAKWTGEDWKLSDITTSDHNYDMGSIYIESNDVWKVIAPTLKGPQAYNPGGELAIWISRDQGDSWKLDKQITHDSEYNHTYVRKPLYAQDDFYAFWADGNARQPSDAHLYYCDAQGNVFELPEDMPEASEKPKPLYP